MSSMKWGLDLHGTPAIMTDAMCSVRGGEVTASPLTLATAVLTGLRQFATELATDLKIENNGPPIVFYF